MGISIKIVMATAFALSAIIAAVVAFVPTFIAGNDGITSSVNTLRSTSILATRNGITAFFNKPASQIEGLHYAATSETVWAMADATRIQRISLLCKIVLGNTAVNSATLSSPVSSSDIMHICDVRFGEDNPTGGYANGTILSVIPFDTTSQQLVGAPLFELPLNAQVLLNDPLYQQGYLLRPMWSAATFGYDRAQFSVGFGFRDTAGDLQLITLTILPDELNALISSVGLRERARAFIADQNSSMVVGNSWGENTVQLFVNWQNTALPPNQRGKVSTPEDLTDPLIKETVAFLGGNAGFFSAATPIATSFDGPDGKTFIDADAVTDQYGLSLRFLVAMPQLDFLEETFKQRDATIGGVVAAVFVIVVVGIVFAVVLARPLDRLGNRMYITASLQDSGEDDPTSALSEIANMQEAYVTMKSELNRMKSYLPQSLLAAMHGDEDEDDGSSATSLTYSQSRSNLGGDDNTSTHSRSSRATRQSALSGPGAVVGGLNMSKNVINKRVSVVVFNTLGSHNLLKAGSKTFTVMQTKLLSMVGSRLRENKGVIDSFQGDHVIATFNAVNNVASAGKRAALAALAVANDAKSGDFTQLTCGISCGACLVGNMGTEDMSRFNIVGEAFVQAMALEREAATLMRTSEAAKARSSLLLATQSVMADAALEVYYQVVDCRESTECHVVSSLEYTKAMATDEWMYQLKEGESNDPFADINSAFEMYVAGDLEGAAGSLRKIEESENTSTLIGLPRLRTLLN